jgi:nitrite reductase (NO-forming)/hydroxylamine reductase
VWATGHLGDAVVTLIGTAPDDPKYKQHAWKVVEELKVPGAGNLFVKTHPKSRNLWVDLPQNPERDLAEAVFVFDLNDLSKPPRKVEVAKDAGLPEMKAIRRAVHPEYNEKGDEVWISVWAGKTDPSAIVIYDDKTLKVKSVIRGPQIITPTGKFNVWNTQNDIY